MVFLFYMSWNKILNKNTSQKNKKFIIFATYIFSLFIIILFILSYLFSGVF
jgi:hypothetical protein